MKKFIYSCLVLAMTALTFSSCEDVPAPYNMPSGDDSETVQPSGSGTAADPFNVAGALKYIEDGGSESDMVYVKGKVVSVVAGSFDATYGSLKYYISDDGTTKNQFYVYNGYAGPNRTKFTGEDALKPGDEVVICGNLIVHNGTKEFQVGNYVVSINGSGSETPDTPAATPSGTGTQADPYNCAAAEKYITDGGSADAEVYVKGKVVSVDAGSYDANYGSLKYYISDDGTASNQFRVYNGYAGPNRTKFSGEDALKPGDEVVICGKLVEYKGTKELNTGNYVVTLNGKPMDNNTPSTPDTPSTSEGISIDGTNVTMTNASATVADGDPVVINLSEAGLTDGQTKPTVTANDVTISFEANGQTAVPTFKNATKGVRVYANNKIVITGAKNIAKIVFTCDSYNGTNYVGNASATIAFDGKTATYVNTYPQSGGTQLRVQTITIYYAK